MRGGIITCMTCMFAVALAMGGRIRRQASQPDKTFPIGGNVTLLCPLVPDDLWKWVYWKKNDHTIYSLDVQSNTPWTNDTRYEGSNHATRLTIKDLKETDSGIYHCKVATLGFTKERGQVLLSVTDQELGLSTTTPGVHFRANSTTIPPQPAVDYKLVSAFSMSFLINIIITVCFVFKNRERIKNLPAGYVSSFRRMAPRSTSTPLAPEFSNCETRDEEGTRTNLLSSDTRGRDDVDVHDGPEQNSNASQLLTSETGEKQLPLVGPVLIDDLYCASARSRNSIRMRTITKVFNDPIHSSVQMPKHCQIIIDTPEFQRLRFIKQLGCTCYVFPSAVHTRFEHSIGVSHLGRKLALLLQDNDRNSSTPILDTEVACVEIACLCRNLGHGPFSDAFEDIVPPDKNGKKWKHEKQSVIMLRYLIKHNRLEKKLEEHNIYADDIDFICRLIQGVKKDEQMIRENKFCLYQIVNNSVNGVDVDKWDCIARDTHYLGMNSAFDFNRILPFVKVLDVKRGCKTRRELCFRDKVASDLNQMFGTRRRLQSTSYQHRVSKIITIMLKDAFQEAADHLLFVGEGGKEYNLSESVKDPEAFCQVNDTIVNYIMRSRSQDPGMVKAREIIDRIHKRELYQCIAECQHANEEMGTVDPAVIKRLIVNDVDELSSPSSFSSSEIWQAHNIEVEASHFDYGSGDENPLLDIPFYKNSSDGKFVTEFLPEDKLPADLPQRLLDVTIRIYTKIPKLDRETINKAKDRCKTRLKNLVRGSSVPTRPVKQKVRSPPIGPMAPSPPISAVRCLTSPSSGSGSFVSTDGDAGIPSLMSAKVTLDSTKRQITF